MVTGGLLWTGEMPHDSVWKGGPGHQVTDEEEPWESASALDSGAAFATVASARTSDKHAAMFPHDPFQ